MFQKTRNMARKYGAQLAGVGTSSLVLVGSAHAALPPEVTAALDDLSTNALLVAGIVLAAIVAIYAFKFIRKGL